MPRGRMQHFEAVAAELIGLGAERARGVVQLGGSLFAHAEQQGSALKQSRGGERQNVKPVGGGVDRTLWWRDVSGGGVK